MYTLTLLLENWSQPTLTLRTPPSKQQALREIPSTIFTGLQRNMKTLDHTKSTKHSPVTYLEALVPIQLPWRLASTHAPPPHTRKCQYRSKLPWKLPDPYQKGTANGAACNAHLTAFLSLSKPNASLWSTKQEPCTTKSMRYGLSTQ